MCEREGGVEGVRESVSERVRKRERVCVRVSEGVSSVYVREREKRESGREAVTTAVESSILILTDLFLMRPSSHAVSIVFSLNDFVSSSCRVKQLNIRTTA